MIIILSLCIPSINYAVQNIDWPDTLDGFESDNPVYTDYVELGTDRETLSLPESVRGFVSIPEDMDISTFIQVEPIVDSSTGTDYYDYYEYGYVKPSDATEKYANDELVIYSIFYASEDGSGDVGEIGYRVYGFLDGSAEVWFTCDVDGTITGAILDVPVTWVGIGKDYDGEEIGAYAFEAVISEACTYTYNGEMPTAIVNVYDITEETTEHATEETTENYGIATMSLDDYEEFLMSDLISDYVTERIASSGNADTESIPGSWIDYLNTMWLNDVGAVSYDTYGNAVWTSKCSWVDTNTVEGSFVTDDDTGAVVGWTGTGADEENLIYASTNSSIYNSDTATWSIYAAEQLLYAMLNYQSGDTIFLVNDIDLNGLNYNWTAVELTESLTIDGNEKTIYNLASYVELSEEDYESDSTRKSAFAYFYGYEAEFVIKDLYFDTGKLVCDATENAPEGTTVEEVVVDYAIFGLRTSMSNLTFENVHVDNYLVISKASSVAVLLGLNNTASWDDTTGDLTELELNHTIENCSVSNSWVYGHDHVGSIATFASDTEFLNSYAVGNTLISTGYHSGSFVSCLNNRSTFDSCFAADNYLYSATQSGGFVGYAGDAADYTDCYASGVVEGYSYIGGFAGATSVGHDYSSAYNTDGSEGYAYQSRNYNTFTNCYSTTLVGMRTATNNSGGFIGVVKYNGERVPTEATLFDSCYAAGEVGSTQTVNETNTENVGGFVGYDQTYANETNDPEGDYITEYINCYYDKQTTAMREWVSGRYSSTSLDNVYEIAITGVLTSDTEKYGTGLTSEPNIMVSGHTEDQDGNEDTVDPEYGFIGFSSNEDWEFVDEHYPQLDVFANASSDDWENPELVQAYSLASTATVILDTWDYGYNWDEEGIRSEEKELYSETYVSTADHIGDRYTYDTVREVVSNATITDTATFAEIIENGIETQSYWYDEENQIVYDESKNISNKESLTESKYYGETAFELNNTYDTLTVTAPGIDWYSIEETVSEEVGTRPIRLISFMKVDAGDDQILSASDTYDHKDDASFTMIDTIKENMVVSLNAEEAWSTSLTQNYPENNNFYQVDTVDTQFTASEGAWVNTEIWRAESVTWSLDDSDFTPVENEADRYYYTDEEGVVHYFSVGQDGVIYYEEEIEGETVLSELYASEEDENGNVTYYTAEYSVKVAGTVEGDDMTTTQEKWNGEIPLYPELEDSQYYIVRYYWVLDNGRYRSDYKIVEINEESVDIEENHDVTIRVFNESDGLSNENVLAIYGGAYEIDSGINYAEDTASYFSTSMVDDDGNILRMIPYGVDSYVSWSQTGEASVITRTILTMTSNNGYVVGEVETEGNLQAGDVITIPMEYFYIKLDEEEGTQETVSVVTEIEYVVMEDEYNSYYLLFAQETDIYDGEDYVTTITDTQYNITFDIYVEESASIIVTKQVTNDTEAMSEQSFILEIEELNTQIVLKHGETSLPIYTNAFDANGELNFHIEEILPMEFALSDITYTVNSGASISYSSDLGITLTYGDEVAIVVDNTYEGEAYFKARDEVTNTFDSNNYDE